MNALLLALLLAGTPESAPAPAPELVLPEGMLQSLLEAAAPFNHVMDEEVSVLGISRKVRLDLRLTRPRVAVAPDGVRVTFDYDLRGPAGMSQRGQLTPKLELRPLEGRGVIEGRLTGARLSATGMEIPLDDLFDPVHLPALAEGPLDVGGTSVQAAVEAKEIVLEPGQIRVKGAWRFAKAPPKSRATTATETAP